MGEQIGLLPGIEVKNGVLAIRAMNPCKARSEAIDQLQKQAENWINENAHLGIYIKGNVPSSKNSKEIGKFKKRDDNGMLKEFTTLRDSAITTAFKRISRPQWVNGRRLFIGACSGLKLPISVEFTFIRDSLRRFDYHNAVQVCADIMVECGYITDDETCYLKPVFGDVYYSKNLAGVIIKVLNP
ncbi:MAG: crossover junction endodeoxyribonuclease RusA [Mucilaginibacter sp.]|nr:crossover junction endodeoxyribonuclease RusA [Mucilaginibacter sp.]